MGVFYKAKNYSTCASFARRLLELNVSQQVCFPDAGSKQQSPATSCVPDVILTLFQTPDAIPSYQFRRLPGVHNFLSFLVLPCWSSDFHRPDLNQT